MPEALFLPVPTPAHVYHQAQHPQPEPVWQIQRYRLQIQIQGTQLAGDGKVSNCFDVEIVKVYFLFCSQPSRGAG